jgi:nicotinamide-nucleotide amidase
MPEPSHTRLAAEAARLARSSGLTVAVAESLTGGMVASALSAAEAAAQWFRGGLVAYSSEVKHEVLGVPDGPVVSAEAADAMAGGVRRLLRADLAVAVTGAGGPDRQDGAEPGTVYLALDDGADVEVRRHQIGGEPEEVCTAAAGQALSMLVERLRARS